MFGRIRGKMAARLSQRTEQNHFGRMLSQITKEQFGWKSDRRFVRVHPKGRATMLRS